jgi:hypothetical protein
MSHVNSLAGPYGDAVNFVVFSRSSSASALVSRGSHQHFFDDSSNAVWDQLTPRPTSRFDQYVFGADGTQAASQRSGYRLPGAESTLTALLDDLVAAGGGAAARPPAVQGGSTPTETAKKQDSPAAELTGIDFQESSAAAALLAALALLAA